MPKLLYLGRNSFRIITSEEKVIYLDPYAGDNYSLPADLILVTHQHGDHNRINKVNKKENCIVISNSECIIDNKYQTFILDHIKVEAVEAYNKNHKKEECVGFLLFFDNILLYFSGDTSKTKEMEELAKRKIDYAFYCTDGFYNMDYKEATECANIVNAKHSIPVHTSPNEIYDINNANLFNGINKLIILPNEEIML